MSKIPWTEKTRNHIVGCSPLSNGCKNCYAKDMFYRQRGMKTNLYKDMKDFDDVKWDMNILKDWLKTFKKPSRIFLCSMSDLFHKKVPDVIIEETIEVISKYSQHTFLLLTKRYERLSGFLWGRDFPKHINFGISICNNEDLKRALDELIILQDVFISFEPLLEELHHNSLKSLLEDVNWVIVGSEAGNRRRDFNELWALNILEAARALDIPFFFKQQFKGKDKIETLNGIEYKELERRKS